MNLVNMVNFVEDTNSEDEHILYILLNLYKIKNKDLLEPPSPSCPDHLGKFTTFTKFTLGSPIWSICVSWIEPGKCFPSEVRRNCSSRANCSRRSRRVSPHFMQLICV